MFVFLKNDFFIQLRFESSVGHTCNYAVVLAQLYTKGRCHGIHPFIVQLRDEDTWLPMPGNLAKCSEEILYL